MTAIAVKGQVCASATTDPTKTMLARMLRERTGTSILDSGGEPRFDADGKYAGSQHGYGRNWERNVGRDFATEAEAAATFRHGEISVVLHAYHWLAARLDYNETEDDKFAAWCELPANEDEHWLANMEAYMKYLATLADPDRGCCDACRDDNDEECDGSCTCHEHREPPSGIYRDGEPLTVNTYNAADLLSQTLQYVFWTDHDGAHVLLQIHGGADVRGGYTRPRYFDVTGDSDETCIFDNARATIACDNAKCGAHWSTDDGYRWYDDGTCGRGHVQLESYDKIEASDDLFMQALGTATRMFEEEDRQGSLVTRTASDITAMIATSANENAAGFDEGTEEHTHWMLVAWLAEGKRFLRFTHEGEGYCPKCQNGELAAYLW